jgi:hypothetical protein
MIANDQEFQGMQERIAFFYRLLAQMRVTVATPEEYRLFSNSYLAEIERLHAAVLTYLKRHASEPVPAEAARIPSIQVANSEAGFEEIANTLG